MSTLGIVGISMRGLLPSLPMARTAIREHHNQSQHKPSKTTWWGSLLGFQMRPVRPWLSIRSQNSYGYGVLCNTAPTPAPIEVCRRLVESWYCPDVNSLKSVVTRFTGSKATLTAWPSWDNLDWCLAHLPQPAPERFQPPRSSARWSGLPGE